MSNLLKSTIELLIKILPIAAIAVLIYILFISADTEISEGIKLSASALLGAIASYVFIEYSRFIEKIEKRKAAHRSALANLEFKLNEQMIWLSDVIFHLSGHERIVRTVIDGKEAMAHDSSSYRDSIPIESEIHDLASLSFKNELLSLLTLYRKLQNDITSQQRGYEFMLNAALTDAKNFASYKRGLPSHLQRTIVLRKHTEFTLRETKLALSKCRVLSSNNRSLLASFTRYLIQQPDPPKYRELVQDDLGILEREISESIATSQKEIDEIERT